MNNFHRKGPENRFSQLVTFFSIHQTFIFKTKQPRGSLKKKALENEDQNTQHEAPKSQKQILNYVFKVQLQDLL